MVDHKLSTESIMPVQAMHETPEALVAIASAFPSNATPIDPQTTSTTESIEHDTQTPLFGVRGALIPSRGLNSRSCYTCHRRKIKCDKLEGGCSNCLKLPTECTYPSPSRAHRRPKIEQISERERELLKRLKRLEGVVEELTSHVELEPAKLSPSISKEVEDGDNKNWPGKKTKGIATKPIGLDGRTASTKTWLDWLIDSEEGPSENVTTEQVGKLVIDEGKSRYISNTFLARFNGEVDHIREMFEDCESPLEEEEEDDTPDAAGELHTSIDADDHSFIMGYSSSAVNLRSLHPLPSQIPFYWNTFKENVDPLVKIIHVPTMAKIMKEAQENLTTLSRSNEALLFAIYFATITSMSVDEVRSKFGANRMALLYRYKFATKQALARAGFLHTSEIVILQAFVLFLGSVRRFDNPRFVWTLTGVAIRIAQSIGLHRDGTKFGLSPFDIEMRRRCWWHICMLDVRAAEDHGLDPSIMEQSFDTELPLNINDADLDPQSIETPKPRIGASEMTFCLIRYEICHTTQRMSSVPSKATTFADKEKLVRACHERVETKYLSHCQDAGPLLWVATIVARLVVAKMGLIIYLGSPTLADDLPKSTKDHMFIAAIEIMEYSHLLQTEASIKKWGWLFDTHIPWDAISYILREICVRPNDETVERSWRAVDSIFSDWDVVVKRSRNGILWAPMRKLMAKARKKREQDMEALAASVGSLQSSNTAMLLGASAPTNLTTLLTAGPVAFPQHTLGNLDPIHPLQQGLPTTARHTSLPPNIVDMNMAVFMAQQQQYQQQMQRQRQSEYQQTGLAQSNSWVLDESALLDLDMNDTDGKVLWEEWDDMVRDFHMEIDTNVLDVRGPSLSGTGEWW